MTVKKISRPKIRPVVVPKVVRVRGKKVLVRPKSPFGSDRRVVKKRR